MEIDNEIKILIADDHSVIRQGIRVLLEREPDMSVVAEASDGQEAIDRFQEYRPDILLLDISMPGMNGLEVSRTIQNKGLKAKVVFLTMHESDEYFFQALAAGASGYVVKGASADELMTAIRSVNKGGIYLQPTLAKNLVTDYLRTRSSAAYDGLTPREAEVLRLIADGLTNKQIAGDLFISPTTVQTHRANLMEKLNLHTQAELIKYAIRKGILSP